MYFKSFTTSRVVTQGLARAIAQELDILAPDDACKYTITDMQVGIACIMLLFVPLKGIW